jgi:hypothetical protein
MLLGRIDEHDRVGQAEAAFLISWQDAAHVILSLSCDDSDNQNIRRNRGDHDSKGVTVLILTGKLPTLLPICLDIQASNAAPPDQTLCIQFRNTAFTRAFKGVAAPDNGSPLGE